MQEWHINVRGDNTRHVKRHFPASPKRMALVIQIYNMKCRFNVSRRSLPNHFKKLRKKNNNNDNDNIKKNYINVLPPVGKDLTNHKSWDSQHRSFWLQLAVLIYSYHCSWTKVGFDQAWNAVLFYLYLRDICRYSVLHQVRGVWLQCISCIISCNTCRASLKIHGKVCSSLLRIT